MPPKTLINRNYFTQETEDAILLYNKTESSTQRSKIYSKHIHYPFFKLTQNIIHTFKFYNTDVDDLEHLQHEIIVFLLGKTHLYHHSKSIEDRLRKIINIKYRNISYSDYLKNPPLNENGKPKTILTKDQFLNNINISSQYPLHHPGSFMEYANNSDKITLEQIRDFIEPYLGEVCEDCKKELKRLTPPKAYSYFGTIVKRWLINYTKKNYNNKINSHPIEDLHHSLDFSYGMDSSNPTQDQLSTFLDSFVDYIDENLYKLFPKSKDAQVADAILEIFRKRESIEIFNKKALYIYIREQGDFKTQKITKISSSLAKIFKEKYTTYLEKGYLEFEEV
tara:strand:+ start:2283 stop:3290 length:1008 start_codon:yes stop_codon:yes gene_type:complete